MRSSRLSTPVIVSALIALAGCREPKIKTYDAPKDAAPSAASMAGLVANSAATAADIRWQTPPGWQEQPGNSVRIGSFLILAGDGRRADVSVTNFGGEVGGALANINRWRDQIQLGPIGDDELARTIQSLDLPAGAFSLVDLVSEKPVVDGKFKSRTLGAWLKQPGRTWFFKMSGEADLVASQRDAFLAFLRSVQVAASPPPHAHAHTGADVGAGAPASSGAAPTRIVPAAPLTPATSASTAASSAPTAADAPAGGASVALTWKARLDWTAKPLGPMRKGSYGLRGTDGAEGDLSIISFPGPAGGLLNNLNRWREQLQLPLLDAAAMERQIERLENGALVFSVVDFAGTTATGPSRVLGAVLPVNDETFFFKLTGPDAFVAAQKPAFLAFLKTVQTR